MNRVLGDSNWGDYIFHMNIQKRTKLSMLMLYWLPVILVMLIIFFASSQPYEKQDVRPFLGNVVNEEFAKKHFSNTKFNYNGHEVSIKSKGVPGFIEFFIRKAAHLTEYTILGFLLLRGFNATTDLSKKVAGILALLISFVYACSDELHQMFTLNRTPLFIDVVLDSVGAFLGILLFLGMRYIILKIKYT